MNARCSTPETICLLCGDRGWSNAFVYCVKCLNVAVHRYCLDVVPTTMDEFVHWICNFCDHSTSAPSSSTVPSTPVATAPTPTPLDSAAAPARDDRGSTQDSWKGHCRSNLNRLAKIYEGKNYKFPKEKKDICKKSIFFKLIGTLTKKKNNLGYFEQLVTLYDDKKQAFFIKDRHLKLCAEEIAYLTGLPCKGQVVVEKKSSSLPTYFVKLCKRYGKVPSEGSISTKLISDLLEIMVIETEEDKDDFKRLLNTMVFFVISVKSQGKVPRWCMLFCDSLKKFNDINWPQVICDRIHTYMKKRNEGGQKKSITCMVQVLEAWFNMRTGLILKTEGILCSKDGDELAPILTYLGKKLSKVDAGNYFEQINPDNISNCRDPKCRSQERILDNEDVEMFSYRCTNNVMFTLIDDYIGAYVKHLLSTTKLGICDDVENHFLRLIKEFEAVDNLNLFKALHRKGKKLLQGLDALEASGRNEEEQSVAESEAHLQMPSSTADTAGNVIESSGKKRERELRMKSSKVSIGK